MWSFDYTMVLAIIAVLKEQFSTCVKFMIEILYVTITMCLPLLLLRKNMFYG